ncbi:MAG: HPF/RaiA family ribosome-associated protein, partial [Anaerolineales bacterium]
MELPVQITFRNLDHSEEVESFIREKAARLDSFYDRIMSCRVMVELPHQRHRSSNLHHVRIELTVPGGELTVSRKGTLQIAHNQTQAAKRLGLS